MQKIELKKQFRVYAEYKDLGVEWINQIPRGWMLLHLQDFGHFTSSGIDKKMVEGEPAVLMVNYMDIYSNPTHEIRNNREYMMTSCPGSKVKCHSIKKGDLLFTPSSETEDDIGHSAVVVEDFINTVYSYHLLRFRPKKKILDLKFEKYLCNNSFVLAQFSKRCKGTTRQILGREVFKKTEVVVPPVHEQVKIAEYLDAKTQIINKIIEQKQKLIALLQEKRAAVINKVVTCGLDENVELVDSGVERIGNVPKGWKVEKLKFVGQAIIGLTYSPEDVTDEVEGTLVLRSSNIQNSAIELNDNVYVKKIIPKSLKTKKGDILICSRNGSAALIGKSAVIDGTGEGVTFGVFMSIFRSRYWKYMEYFFKSELFFFQLRSSATSTINQLTIDDLKNIIATVPSIDKQERIAIYLNKKICEIDFCTEKVKKSVKLLQEYKSSLIYNVVTGKVMKV